MDSQDPKMASGSAAASDTGDPQVVHVDDGDLGFGDQQSQDYETT